MREIPAKFRNKRERQETREILEEYFLDDGLSTALEDVSWDCLISAEISFRHQELGYMVNEIRKLLELELPTMLLTLEPALNREDRYLILTRMRYDLMNNQIVRAVISSLKIDSDDKTWLFQINSRVLLSLGQLPKPKILIARHISHNRDMNRQG